MDVGISLTGDEAVKAMLNKTAEGVADLTEPLTDTAKYLVNYYSGVSYASRGSVFGSRWPALNPAYDLQKRRKFGSKPMLIATGAMQRSYKFTVSALTATIFNDVRSDKGFPYFEAHQTGTRRMPARPTMGINNTLETDVNGIVNASIRGILAEAIG